MGERWNTSFMPLIWGLVLSLILIFTGYFMAIAHLPDWLIVSAGTLQALIQLVFFLHLGLESKPRWGLMIFLFLVLIVVVIIGGSLWIMHNLDYNLMIPGSGAYN